MEIAHCIVTIIVNVKHFTTGRNIHGNLVCVYFIWIPINCHYYNRLRVHSLEFISVHHLGKGCIIKLGVNWSYFLVS